MISPDRKTFSVISDKQIRANFNHCQIKTLVQTACESHDLNMNFQLFHFEMLTRTLETEQAD